MRIIYLFIALVLMVTIMTLWPKHTFAGGPWNDQYCNVEITKIKVVDDKGQVIENRTEEKMVCDDGAKDFLHGMGIADSCQIFTWNMPIGETLITQRQIACHKMNGEYEIVQGYHGID